MSELDNKRSYSRRLRGIVFADIVGYARLMAMDEDGTSLRIANLINDCETMGASYRGELVQTSGDGMYFLFDSVVDAVQLAMKILAFADESNKSISPEEHVRFRIGIHMGDVLQADNQYVGESVNIAARLETQASPGSICISSTVYEQVKHKIAAGFEYIGCVDLKNIPDPIDIFKISNDTQLALVSASPRSRNEVLKLIPDDEPINIKPTIAVLPFSNQSSHDRDNYFADGITEDLITNLSRFHGLAVISRSSTFVYKNRNVATDQIGKELGARYIVTGSIRQSGNRLRLTVELSDCNNSVPIWRERYNREVDDIFEMQDEITDLLSTALAVQAQSADKSLGRIQVPALIETYTLVLLGQQRIFKYNREQNIQARQMYEAALQRETDYSRAIAALSRTYNLEWRYSWTNEPEYALEKALELAQESVRIDPADARGFGELGFVNLYRKDHEASLNAFEKALRLNPNDTDIMSNMGDALAHCGRSEEAIELLTKALTLNPFYPDQYLWYLGGAYFNLRQYHKVIKVINQMNSPAEGRRLLAASNAYLGKKDEARYQAAKVLEAYPNFKLEHWEKVLPDLNPDDTEHFVQGLRLAGLE